MTILRVIVSSGTIDPAGAFSIQVLGLKPLSNLCKVDICVETCRIAGATIGFDGVYINLSSWTTINLMIFHTPAL